MPINRIERWIDAVQSSVRAASTVFVAGLCQEMKAMSGWATPSVFTGVLWVWAMMPTSRGLAQDDATMGTGVTIGVDEGKRPATQPEGEPALGLGVSYSQVVPNLGANQSVDNAFQQVRIGATEQEKLGPGGLELNLNLFPGGYLQLPGELGARGQSSFYGPVGMALTPANSLFHTGPVYWFVPWISGTVLVSDNVNLDNQHKKFGAISIVRVPIITLFPVLPGLRFALAGTVIYLPFRSTVGVAGFGIGDPFAALAGIPLAHAQLIYQANVAGWDAQAYDDFRVIEPQIGAEYVLYPGQTFDQQDQAGRYEFGVNHLPYGQEGTTKYYAGLTPEGQFLESINQVGGSVARVLPTETRLELGAYHNDFWYYGGDTRFLPHSADTIYLFAQEVRDNMRFKPYLNYRMNEYSGQPGWNHWALAGLRGPVNDYISIWGGAGYFWSDSTFGNETLAQAGFFQDLTPSTSHSFSYRRTVTEPSRALATYYQYFLRQQFGPELTGWAYATHVDATAISRGAVSSSDDYGTVLLSYSLGRSLARAQSVSAGGPTLPQPMVGTNFMGETTLQGLLSYGSVTLNSGSGGSHSWWRGEVDLVRPLGASTAAVLTYRYQSVTTEGVGALRYDENMVMLTLTKTF